MIFPKVYEKILTEAQKKNSIPYAYIDGYCWYLMDNNSILFKDEDNILNCSSTYLKHVQPDQLIKIKELITYKSPIRLHLNKCEKLENGEKRVRFLEGYNILYSRYRLFKTQKTNVAFFGENNKVYVINLNNSKIIAVIASKK